MNKNIALVLSCAVSILALVSCNNKETDLLKPKDKTHTVIFKAQTPAASETKTALRLEVVPDWRKTNPDDVHIFETQTSSTGATYTYESTHVNMETPIGDDYSLALFSAAFDNASAIVTPPTKAESTPGYKYTAIMASTSTEGEVVKYIVPSEQYPDEVAWIDPKADMLVGSDPTIYPHYLEEDEVIGLSFKRPVALARLAITNLEGTTVSKVKMTTANHITGYVTYDEINFDEKTVAGFKGDDSNKELTILYPEGKKKTTTFYAYFVCVPGTIQFSKIEVFTDQYVFTKTYATPASLPFTAGDFKNIALDMTPKDNNGVTRTGLGQQTLKFVDANQQEVTAPIEFDLVNGKDKFVAPTLVIGDDVVDQTKVTVTSNNEEVATVDAGVVTLFGATGEATITASVPGDDDHAAGYASYKIIVTDTTAPATVTFYKAEELVAGQEYIIVSGGQAMTLDGTTLGVTAVTDVDGVIETDKDVALWTAAEHVEYYEGTSPAGHYTLKSGDNYLQRHSDNSTQTGAAGEVPSTKKYYVWEYDGTHLYHHSSSSNTFYLGYNDNVWKFNYQSPYYTTTLYSTSKPRTKQVITFGEEPVTAKYDLNGAKWTVAVPSISGNKTEVTYSISGDESIKVNATSGEVTIENTAKKGDKATVTATAAQTDEYTSATASYTIEIIDSSTPSTTATYTLVTKQEDVVEGKYLIVSAADAYVYDGSGTYQGGYATIAEAENITLDGTKITISGDTAAYEFAFAKSGNGFTITGAKGMIVAAANGTNVPSAEETYITFAETGGSVFLQRGSLDNKPEALLFSTTRGTSSEEYLYYHTTNKIFKIGGSGKSNGVHLYFAGERTAQSISFSKTEDSYDMASGDDYDAPTLSGEPKTQVNYSSSDTNVATVDANGAVTIKGKGETTITATAVASSEYLSATASFKLTVKNTNVPTYYKADEVVDGHQYLIISNNYALKNNNGSAAATNLSTSIEGDVIKYDPATSELWTATVSSGSITFKNDTRSLYRSSSNISLSTSSASSFTYDADNEYLTTKGSNSTYYLYYGTSFQYSTTANKAVLYSTTVPLPKWDISYDVDAAEYDQFTQGWTPSMPVLTTTATNVTYASSDETVATVSATGQLTVLKMGETKITATAAADATHKKTEASYTLTVVSSDPDLPKYTKVTSTSDLTAGAKYLLVFEGLANDTDGDGDPKVFKANLNSNGSQFAKATESALPVKISNSTIASNGFGDNEFTLETGYYLKGDKANMYIYPGSASNSSVMLAESSASHALTIEFSNGIAQIKNGNYYLVWSTSSHYFSCNTAVSGQYSTGICLYKLVGSGGSTPEPPTPSTSTYTLVEDYDNVVTGTYLIVDKSNARVFTASGTDNAGYTSVSATGISKDGSTITISGTSTDYEFDITRTGNTLTLKQVSSNKYIYCTTSSSTSYIGLRETSADFTLLQQTGTNHEVYFHTTRIEDSSANQYLYYKSGTGSGKDIFKLGGSGSPTATDPKDAGVLLYKKNSTNN